MAVRKISIALDPGVADAAAQAASRRGLSLSAWLGRAARHELAIEAGLAAVDEWEAEHGALPASDLAWADAVLDEAGVRPRQP